jgi:2-methylisocitrate lyase-like PEP mutase family enzyme
LNIFGKGDLMTGKSIKQLLNEERPLIMVVAHDALSARLIEMAGFRVYTIGGFALVGVRYGLPDVGVASFGEIAAGVKDIMRGSSLPVIVDGDDGYGDVKNITRTVETYEEMGVAGIVFEDQTSPKRCGHMAGKNVVSIEQAELKLKAALAARKNPDFFIIARTDARAVYGLDDALNRARRFQEIGVDCVFVEAPRSVEELEIIGRSFDIPVLVNMAEGGLTPILPPEELAKMGFSIVVYPATLLFRVTRAIQQALTEIKAGKIEPQPDPVTFKEITEIMGISKWAAVDDRFWNGPEIKL